MSTGDEIFLVSQNIADLLEVVEREDVVLAEKVDLNACIPALDGPVPILRSRQSKHALIDPESLTKASITAAGKARKSTAPEESNRREKEELRRKLTQLETTVEEKTQLLKELRNEKERLERQLSDGRTRSRLGSRTSVVNVGETSQPSPMSENVQYWKQMYETMRQKFEQLLHALSSKGSMTRVSIRRSREIIPPDGALRFDTLEPKDS